MTIVSVVVPVYKTEAFVDKCVQSIVAQTIKNIEIILVDDGSPDACPQKCDAWKNRDSRIKVIHQKNQGVTRARANGVALASGEWICFVDSDDELPFDAIENLIDNVQKVDIVVGQINFLGPYNWPYPQKAAEYDRDAFLRCFLRRRIHSGPVAKMYKRKLFDEFVFEIPPVITCGEDFIMNLRIADKADAIRIVNAVVYCYYYRENSAVTKNPFASAKYSLLFNRLVCASVHVTSLSLFVSLMGNLMSRLWICVKGKLKRCFRRIA